MPSAARGSAFKALITAERKADSSLRDFPFFNKLEAKTQAQVDATVERLGRCVSAKSAKIGLRQRLSQSGRKQIALDQSRIHGVKQIMEENASGQGVALAAGIASAEAARSRTASAAWTSAAAPWTAAESASRTSRSAAALVILRRDRFAESPRAADAQIEIKLTVRIESVDRHYR